MSVVNAGPGAPEKKLWRPPAVIQSEAIDGTAKLSYPRDTVGSVCTATCHPTNFGPS